MSDQPQFEELQRQLKDLGERLAASEQKPRRGWLHLGEKLLIPLALGLLAFTAHTASNRIAEGQLELSRAQRVTAHEEAQLAKQLNFLELFYEEGSSPERQLTLLGLLLPVDPDTGTALARAMAQNTANSQSVRDEAQQLLHDFLAYGPLATYSVLIYCEGQKMEREGLELQEALRRAPFEVSVHRRSPGFFDRAGRGKGLRQIRYAKEIEREPAERLQQVLGDGDEESRYHLQPVKQPSLNRLSIFLMRGD